MHVRLNCGRAACRDIDSTGLTRRTASDHPEFERCWVCLACRNTGQDKWCDLSKGEFCLINGSTKPDQNTHVEVLFAWKGRQVAVIMRCKIESIIFFFTEFS